MRKDWKSFMNSVERFEKAMKLTDKGTCDILYIDFEPNMLTDFINKKNGKIYRLFHKRTELKEGKIGLKK